MAKTHTRGGKGLIENNLQQHIQQLQNYEKGGIEGARWHGFQYAQTASIGMKEQPVVFKFGMFTLLLLSFFCSLSLHFVSIPSFDLLSCIFYFILDNNKNKRKKQ